MPTLAEIRARLQAQENRKTGNNLDRAIYPHWNIEEGQSAVLRFLPDADTSNSFFWVERAILKFPFPGVKNGENKQVVVQVPCMETWGETCPVLTEVRGWFRDKSLEELGRKYWKKRTYIMQGFVRENPLSEEAVENPIRRFIMSPQLFTNIKSALLDPEVEEMPTDLERGLDFRVIKGSKGGYADYSTSKWSRKETPLTAQEKADLGKHGLFNLSEFLPKRPSPEEIQAIVEMFHASVDGEPYDVSRWGQFYKPWGLGGDDEEGSSQRSTGSGGRPVSSKPPATTTTAPPPAASQDNTPPWEAATPAASTAAEPSAATTGKPTRAEDILSMIRNRQSQARS